VGWIGAMAVVVTACLFVSYGWGEGPAADPAQSAAGSPQQLAAMARAAKGQFRPLTEADAQQALARLTAAVEDLQQRLNIAGQKGEDWKKYVLWDQLQDQLRQPKPDAAALGGVFKRFSAGYEGLELKWFVQVRQALQRYLEVSGAVGNAGVKDAYVACLDGLAGQLDSWAARPSTDATHQIAESLAWLENARQAPELVAAVRARFDRPNFCGRIAGDVVAAGIAQDVDETAPVSDVILGTFINGVGRTVGRTQARLVPDGSSAVFDAVLLATNSSRSVGSHPPVCIYTCGTTCIGACKRFWMDGLGLHAYSAVSCAETHSTISDIRDTKCRKFVEKLAWRKALKQEGTADVIAGQHAQVQVNRRIDEQALEAIERSNTNYEYKVRGPLADRLAFPRQLGFSTTADGIVSTGWEAAANQLAAPSEAPEPGVPSDLSLRLHESAVNNLAATVLAGLVLREDMFQSTMTSFTGRLPERLKDDKDEEPWTIVFDQKRPISVTFADNGYKVTIRGQKFFRGENPYPGMDITFAYKFVKTDGGFKVVRQGEVQIFPPGFVPGAGKQLSARQQAIRTILQKKLGKALEKEAVAQGFTLGGKWAAAGKFAPVEITARDGWLVIAWRRTVVPAATATAAIP
jgi:hypothetical protein